MAALAAATLISPTGAGAQPAGSFYTYSGATSLSSTAPGTVLKTRTLKYHVQGVPLPLTVVQLLYRSTGPLGQATTNVTSVIEPPKHLGATKVVSYQSFYDSLNPADEPSQVIAGGRDLDGGSLPTAETAFIAPLLLRGYTVNVPDTEGQAADFAAGPVYGINTLDSLRAAYNSSATDIPATAKAALEGYSGGAIGTGWAAQLAPTYAPDVNRRLVGASMGGVLVDPDHNLHYIDGSKLWAGVMPMALIGIARAYGVDLTPYLSAYGRALNTKLQKASINDALGHYPGLTFAQLARPQYAQPESIPVLVRLANKLILGEHGHPTIPMDIAQGANGVLEGTSGNTPGIGRGDGVMVAGDVRSLAREYCADGLKVRFTQYSTFSHTTTAPEWGAKALTWIGSRFAGKTAPQNCSDIAPGNPLTPIPTH